LRFKEVIMNCYTIDILCHDDHVYRVVTEANSEEEARRELIGSAIKKSLWVKKVFIKNSMLTDDYNKLIEFKQNLLDDDSFHEDAEGYHDTPDEEEPLGA